ncbi:S-adenosyl-L-methionine-dependent methyltransferase [Crepidotus variabilis]|uniref:Protein arginine methyltransferase NDUFAF7 n=1 Tax=Crepidotus variabilis TaxID=179855 RepID=A0A9P6EC19_9AGAR|nr:S-adenosyl-L-methionine-dependent methyltransferase [Crepidotus variabilis]
MSNLIRSCGRSTSRFPRFPDFGTPALGKVRKVRLTHKDASAQEMTVVERVIRDDIKTTGPISFARYMKRCLSHPTHGYYMNQEHSVFGKTGDFITSPEISQVFGELIGLWVLTRYKDTKIPLRLVELGPGRGTLMADVLRVLSRFFPSSTIDVHLVETSPTMRALQENALSAYSNTRLRWHNSIFELEPSSSHFTSVVAHEFFDALPIHLIQKTKQGWNDVLIAPREETVEEVPPSENIPARPKASLTPFLASEPSPASQLLGNSSKRFAELPEGTQIEVSPDSFRTARRIGEILQSGKPLEKGRSSVGGCGLIVDYGGDKTYNSSFRAFKDHKIVDVFHKPGECDLTANVDFAYLREAMADIVSVSGPIPQRKFLNDMGLKLRVQDLVAKAAEERKKDISDAAFRLIDPLGMGSQYQVLAVNGSLHEGEEAPFPFTLL